MPKISPNILFANTKELDKMPVALLVSGGIESATLLWLLTQYFAQIYPVYVRLGLNWENSEYQFLLQFLKAIKQPTIQPITVLNSPAENIYGNHWSITGHNSPDASTDDEAVYLPGRNLLLLTQTAIWCSLTQIPFMALGSLGTNPFPDASPKFFDQMQNTLTIGLNFNISILRPFDKMHKDEVILLAKNLPLHLTFSCIQPINGIHCGQCNKCAERQKAFLKAALEDQTIYDVKMAMPV